MTIAEELRWMEAIYYVYWREHEPKNLTWHRQWLSQEIHRRKKAIFLEKRGRRVNA